MQVLMLLDLQVGTCRPEGSVGSVLAHEVTKRGTLRFARECLDSARATGMDVIHVRLAFDQKYRNRTNRTERFDAHEENQRLLAGSEDVRFCPEVEPISGELVVDKGSVSPFASTCLVEWLHARGIRGLSIAGVATHLAVESAAREAADRGFSVNVIADACAAPAPLHEHAISATLPAFGQVITTEEFSSRARAGGPAHPE